MFPKNLERGTGPSPSSLLSSSATLLLDLCFFSFFDLLDVDLDLLDTLSSSLLEEHEDDSEELDSEDLLECCNSSGGSEHV